MKNKMIHVRRWLLLIVAFMTLTILLTMCCSKRKYSIDTHTESYLKSNQNNTEVKYVDTTIINDSAKLITEIIFNPDSHSEINVMTGDVSGSIVSFKQTSSRIDSKKNAIYIDSIKNINATDSTAFVTKKEVTKITKNKIRTSIMIILPLFCVLLSVLYIKKYYEKRR